MPSTRSRLVSIWPASSSDGATLRAERIAERLDEGFLDATTVMEFLIQRGRSAAHRTRRDRPSGRAVRARGLKRLADLDDAELIAAHPRWAPGCGSVLGVPTPSGRSARPARPHLRRLRSSCGDGRHCSKMIELRSIGKRAAWNLSITATVSFTARIFRWPSWPTGSARRSTSTARPHPGDA